jgi:hypothetical protein
VRYNIFIAILAVALGNASIAQAQKNDEKFRVSGRITDKASGAPVQTAVIRFEDLQRAVVTDSMGRFVMEKMPKGTHYAEVSRLGYVPEMEFVQVIADHDSLFVALIPQPLVLEAVTAISNRLERRRNRMPSMVRAFDTKRLATSTVDLKQFLTSYAAPITACPVGRTRGMDDNCVIARGNYRPLRVYLNEMPMFGAPLELYYPGEFELVEYYQASNTIRLYTTAFLERVAKGKAHLDATLN